MFFLNYLCLSYVHWYFTYMCMCVKVLELLELEWRAVMWVLGTEQGLLEEQPMLLAAKPSL